MLRDRYIYDMIFITQFLKPTQVEYNLRVSQSPPPNYKLWVGVWALP
jgi:hypothetical protein